MKPIKKSVYLPVNLEEIKSKLQHGSSYIVKDETNSIHEHYFDDGEFHAPKGRKVLQVIQEVDCFILTPEQLNQLLSGVIKETLKNAAGKATIRYDHFDDMAAYVNEQSILNTFEETFNRFKA